MLKIIKIAVISAITASSIQFSQPVRTERVEAELISEFNSVRPGSEFWVGLRLEMKDGWHTYWRNAGDTGIPTRIKWDLPAGFSAGEINWPYPEAIEVEGLVNFGYEGEVLLLTKISTPENLNSGEMIVIRARADWLVCKVECFPEHAELKLELPVRNDLPAINEEWFDSFNLAREKLPISLKEWDFEAHLTDSSVMVLGKANRDYRENIFTADFFPYEGGYFKYNSDQKFHKTDRGFKLETMLENLRIGDPQKISGILFTDSGWRGAGSEKALEIEVPVEQYSEITRVNEDSVDLSIAVLFAFLGGIILNLMPCVLPVLSIKILGFVNQAGENKRKIAFHGFTFTAGVVASFWVLAGLLILLRTGGEELGWGFQLQSPFFILFLSVILLLFGLNLFGVFEINLPRFAANQRLIGSGGYTGSFISGIAATILATPCTAPFMGSALGFAITQPVFITMTVFTFLALGMAFPYLIFSIFPAWLKLLPKPGIWMESFKQFMGFLLIGTVIWLAWVLAVQTSSEALIYLLICLLIAAIAAWIYGRWSNPLKERRVRFISGIFALILVISGFIIAANSIDRQISIAKGTGSDSLWEEYSEERILGLKNEAKPFFIDFTAAWCLSCQVNKKLALNNEEVLSAFNERGVTLIKADWTSRDERISKALAEYGRNSVPLYVLYGGNSTQPEFLPEILTPDIILDALNKIN